MVTEVTSTHLEKDRNRIRLNARRSRVSILFQVGKDVRREGIPRSKFFVRFEMRGYIRALRLDLMPLRNQLFFRPRNNTCVALIPLVLRIAILFPSLLPTTKFVGLRLPLLPCVLGILEEVQLSR